MNKGTSRSNTQRHILIIGSISALIIFLLGLRMITLDNYPNALSTDYYEKEVILVRPVPDSFPKKTHMPNKNEGSISGSINLNTFSPGRELTYIDDKRVWWESDNDKNDDEDDHTIHRSLEAPLRRLIELVSNKGGQLKVQDSYRPTKKVHSSQSLHKEGRAIDLTCNGLSLEELAKLCWAAGFDWVYYETSGGHHIHCSVKKQ